uniref:Uncharacterized protein n=1 Tax=Steinernema glaseri TaxID=37863 RepID=A0A1I7YQI3_9BILA
MRKSIHLHEGMKIFSEPANPAIEFPRKQRSKPKSVKGNLWAKIDSPLYAHWLKTLSDQKERLVLSIHGHSQSSISSLPLELCYA